MDKENYRSFRYELVYTILYSVAFILGWHLPQLIILKVVNGPDILAVSVKSLGFIGIICVVFFSGFLSRYNRHKLFVTFGCLIAVLMFIIAMLPIETYREESMYVFVGMIILCMLCVHFSENARIAMWRIVYPEKLKGKIMAVFSGVASVLFLVSYPISEGFKNGIIGLQEAYLIGGLFMLASYLIYLKKGPVKGIEKLNVASKEYHPIAQLKSSFSIFKTDKEYLYYQILQMIFGAGNILLMLNRAVMVNSTFADLSITDLAVIDIVIPTALTIISVFFWGWFVDKVGPVKARIIAASSFVITWICFFIGLHLKDLNWIYASSIASGFSVANGQILWRLGHSYFSTPENDSKYFAVHQSLTGVRGLICGFLGLFLYTLIGNWVCLFTIILISITIPGYIKLDKLMMKNAAAKKEGNIE